MEGSETEDEFYEETGREAGFGEEEGRLTRFGGDEAFYGACTVVEFNDGAGGFFVDVLDYATDTDL